MNAAALIGALLPQVLVSWEKCDCCMLLCGKGTARLVPACLAIMCNFLSEDG